MGLPRSIARVALAPVAAIVLLAACAGVLDEPMAHAAPPGAWPPVWQDPPEPPRADYTTPRFDPPSASHCRRAPGTREVPGGGGQGASWRERGRMLADEASRPLAEGRAERAERAEPARGDALAKSADARRAPAGAAAPAPATAPVERDAATSSWPQPMPTAPRQRPPHEPVTAGMVDDNADFGEYLAFRQRRAGLPVRERDISERYLLEVTDAAGRPVHDAEVAIQRASQAEPTPPGACGCIRAPSSRRAMPATAASASRCARAASRRARC
jgi:hypothetical protein